MAQCSDRARRAGPTTLHDADRGHAHRARSATKERNHMMYRATKSIPGKDVRAGLTRVSEDHELRAKYPDAWEADPSGPSDGERGEIRARFRDRVVTGEDLGLTRPAPSSRPASATRPNARPGGVATEGVTASYGRRAVADAKDNLEADKFINGAKRERRDSNPRPPAAAGRTARQPGVCVRAGGLCQGRPAFAAIVRCGESRTITGDKGTGARWRRRCGACEEEVLIRGGSRTEPRSAAAPSRPRRSAPAGHLLSLGDTGWAMSQENIKSGRRMYEAFNRGLTHRTSCGTTRVDLSPTVGQW